MELLLQQSCPHSMDTNTTLETTTHFGRWEDWGICMLKAGARNGGGECAVFCWEHGSGQYFVEGYDHWREFTLQRGQGF